MIEQCDLGDVVLGCLEHRELTRLYIVEPESDEVATLIRCKVETTAIFQPGDRNVARAYFRFEQGIRFAGCAIEKVEVVGILSPGLCQQQTRTVRVPDARKDSERALIDELGIAARDRTNVDVEVQSVARSRRVRDAYTVAGKRPEC